MTAGDKYVIVFKYYDKEWRTRVAVFYVGENGIKPAVRYKLSDDKTTLVETTPTPDDEWRYGRYQKVIYANANLQELQVIKRHYGSNSSNWNNGKTLFAGTHTM